MNDEQLARAMHKAWAHYLNHNCHLDDDVAAMRAALAVVREARGKDAERLKHTEYELAVERAKNEHLFSVLMGIHNLEFPRNQEVNGITYKFEPKDPTMFYDMYRTLCQRIREIPQAIDAARVQEKQS